MASSNSFTALQGERRQSYVKTCTVHLIQDRLHLTSAKRGDVARFSFGYSSSWNSRVLDLEGRNYNHNFQLAFVLYITVQHSLAVN